MTGSSPHLVLRARRSRGPVVAVAVLAALLALTSCSSSTSSSASAHASNPSVTAPPASRFTPAPAATGVAPAYVWCSNLASALGKGLEVNATEATSVLTLITTQSPATAAAKATWPSVGTDGKSDVKLGYCAIGKPLSAAKPVPTPAATCPSGHATVTTFPPTTSYLVDATGKHVELSGAAAIRPDPVVRCT